MSLAVKPVDGSRSVLIDTPYLYLDAIVHPDGTVETRGHEIRDPRTPTPEALLIAEAKAKVCDDCEHSQGVTRYRGDQPVYGVKCKQCGCGLFRLLSKSCPVGKHQT